MSQSNEIQYLLSLVDKDPKNWVLRKEAALKLYEAGEYLQSANMVWETPEIPSTDMDVAFAVKMVSRARPNRSIRLVYELLDRNSGKAEQYIAMANVFNLIGFPMLASRCYGAAMTLNEQYFDMGFESESFFLDESKELKKAWAGQGSGDSKAAFSENCMELIGEPIYFEDLDQSLEKGSFKNASEAAVGGDVKELGAALQKFNRITTELREAEEEVPPPPLPTLQLGVHSEAGVKASGGATPAFRFMPPPAPQAVKSNRR